MKRVILLFLIGLLVISIGYSEELNGFQTFVNNYFNIILTAIIFLISFSLFFPAINSLFESKQNAVVIALSISIIISLVNYTYTDFSEVVKSFILNVPYALIILLGFSLLFNLVFGPNKAVKIIGTILFILLIILTLYSTDVIQLQQTSTETPTSENSIISYALIGIVAVIIVTISVRKMLKQKKSETRTESENNNLEDYKEPNLNDSEKIEYFSDVEDIKYLRNNISNSNFWKGFNYYYTNDKEKLKEGVKKFKELFSPLKSPIKKNILNSSFWALFTVFEKLFEGEKFSDLKNYEDFKDYLEKVPAEFDDLEELVRGVI